jgi:hypothetical protein
MARPKAPASRSTLRAAENENLSRPDVILDFIFDDGLFFISIENIGDRPALKVSTAFDQKIVGLHGSREISALPLFKRIEFLAPHKAIKTFLDSSTAYFSRNEPTRISVNISYLDSNRKQYSTTILHDLEIYKDIAYLSNSREALAHEEEKYGRPAR